MKKVFVYIGFLLMTIVCCSLFSEKRIRFCDKGYIAVSRKVYLADEGLEATLVSVIDNQTKKHVFGFYKSALRNDTNFIYTRFDYIGDTIVRKEYHDFKISKGTDSIITDYLCTETNIAMHRSQRFWNGAKVEDTTLRLPVKR